MYGSDHTYSPYRPSPSPGQYGPGYLGTPSPAPYSPRSPYTADEDADWHTPDLEVSVVHRQDPTANSCREVEYYSLTLISVIEKRGREMDLFK